MTNITKIQELERLKKLKDDGVLSDEEFVEYNHLRQTKILGDWHKALCKLRLNDCDNPTKDIEEERKRLYQTQSFDKVFDYTI